MHFACKCNDVNAKSKNVDNYTKIQLTTGIRTDWH